MNANDPAKAAQAAAVIERNARAQNQIIEDLLDMSRIVSGKIKLDVRDLDVADVVRAAIDTVAAAAATKAVRITHDVPRDVGHLRGDPHRLQQVIWNLLTNAIKFTPTGGAVRIALERQTGSVKLTVSDTGQGIPAEFLPHIFERFRQADSSSIRQHGGLGLGLAIARQLVELHGGKIAAESDGPGKGSRFVLCLPIVGQVSPRAETERETKTEASGTPLHGLRVLVVDDEADSRELLREVLSGSGAAVQSCDSAQAALDALPTFRPDVLISDIAMPDVNGYDLIHSIRRNGAPYNNLPAVALTAYARAEDRQRALDAGFQEHVAKPVENARLVEVIGRIAARALG